MSLKTWTYIPPVLGLQPTPAFSKYSTQKSSTIVLSLFHPPPIFATHPIRRPGRGWSYYDRSLSKALTVLTIFLASLNVLVIKPGCALPGLPVQKELFAPTTESGLAHNRHLVMPTLVCSPGGKCMVFRICLPFLLFCLFSFLVCLSFKVKGPPLSFPVQRHIASQVR